MNELRNLLHGGKRSMSVMTSAALLTGFFLLFMSIQLYDDANGLLSSPQQKKDGFDYLVVNKKITNAMMGNNAASSFSDQEIERIREQKSVSKVALVTSNRFGITANTLGQLAFSTQLFFESVPEDMLDVVPEKWSWQKGEQTVPVILSAEYLNLYNFGFALSQGLPQMSEETIKAVPFNVTIYDKQHEEQFVATVVGFTQRYSSVLVPASFMQYANEHFGTEKEASTSRVILQTREAGDPELVKYLSDNAYATQSEKLKSSTLRTIIHVVFGACGVIGLLVLTLSVMLLLLYLKLLIVRSMDKLKLLSILGYKPSVLRKQFTNRIIRLLMVLIVVSILFTAIVQFLIAGIFESYAIHLSPWLSMKTILAAILSSVFIAWMLNTKINKIIGEVLNSKEV